MSDISEAEVKVTNRPTRPKRSHIPQEILDHFHGSGHRVRWGSSNSIKLADASGVGWHRVEYRPLPQSVKLTIKEWGYALEGGFITHGDWVLQARTQAAHDRDMGQIRYDQGELESPDYAINQAAAGAQQAREEAPGIGQAAGLLPVDQVFFGSRDTPQDGTTGQLSEEVIAMVKEAEAKKEKDRSG